MYVLIVTSGLTVGSKLFKAGEMVILSDQMLEDYGKLSDEKMIQKQKDIYGTVFFRRPTAIELKEAIVKGQESNWKEGIRPESVTDKRQLRVVQELIKSQQYRLQKFSDALKTVTEEPVEEAPAEKKAPEPEKVEEKAPEDLEEPVTDEVPVSKEPEEIEEPEAPKKEGGKKKNKKS